MNHEFQRHPDDDPDEADQESIRIEATAVAMYEYLSGMIGVAGRLPDSFPNRQAIVEHVRSIALLLPPIEDNPFPLDLEPLV